jgi:hypothetical protein
MKSLRLRILPQPNAKASTGRVGQNDAAGRSPIANRGRLITQLDLGNASGSSQKLREALLETRADLGQSRRVRRGNQVLANHPGLSLDVVAMVVPAADDCEHNAHEHQGHDGTYDLPLVHDFTEQYLLAGTRGPLLNWKVRHMSFVYADPKGLTSPFWCAFVSSVLADARILGVFWDCNQAGKRQTEFVFEWHEFPAFVASCPGP